MGGLFTEIESFFENRIDANVPNSRFLDLDGTDAASQHQRHRSSSAFKWLC